MVVVGVVGIVIFFLHFFFAAPVMLPVQAPAG